MKDDHRYKLVANAAIALSEDLESETAKVLLRKLIADSSKDDLAGAIHFLLRKLIADSSKDDLAGAIHFLIGYLTTRKAKL